MTFHIGETKSVAHKYFTFCIGIGDLMQFKKMMHVCAQARAAADENKNKIQMAGDAIDIYLPFRNISNHKLIEFHAFYLEFKKCVEKAIYWSLQKSNILKGEVFIDGQ